MCFTRANQHLGKSDSHDLLTRKLSYFADAALAYSTFLLLRGANKKVTELLLGSLGHHLSLNDVELVDAGTLAAALDLEPSKAEKLLTNMTRSLRLGSAPPSELAEDTSPSDGGRHDRSVRTL
jgi:hypothetical protein